MLGHKIRTAQVQMEGKQQKYFNTFPMIKELQS